jgi:hypothetical protein
MTKSATAPFHCDVHAQSVLHKPYRRRLDLHLAPRPRRLRSLSGPGGGNCVSSTTWCANDLVRNWRAEFMASHWTAVESRKIQEKHRHFRKNRYDVGIVKAETRGPTRSAPLRAERRCEALPEGRFTIRCTWASASECAGCERGETKRQLSC